MEPLSCQGKRSSFIRAEQMIWLVTKVRRCECSPSRSFSAWPESAALQRGWHGAKSPPANETRSFWRTTTDPKLGEFPKQKPATEFNNWPAMAPYAPQYCPVATRGPVFSAPACCTAVSPGAVLSLFSLFYYFSGNSNQCNHAWCTGWKMVSPSPSSFNLMNCLFSYQRVMSTKPHNIYSWNKRQKWSGCGKQKQLLGVERSRAGHFEGEPHSEPHWHAVQVLGKCKPVSSPHSSLGAPLLGVPSQCLVTCCSEPTATSVTHPGHWTGNCLNLFFVSEIPPKSLFFFLWWALSQHI